VLEVGHDAAEHRGKAGVALDGRADHARCRRLAANVPSSRVISSL
jgi:hypothetical protein